MCLYLSLNERAVIHNKESTFYARVEGNSMIEAGIYDGDYVMIDKSLEANDGDYIAAFIDGQGNRIKIIGDLEKVRIFES